MTEKQKMLAGELYDAGDPALVAERRRARDLCHRYNATLDEQTGERRLLLEELLGTAGRNLLIEPSFRCDYGSNIHLGDGVFMNFNCVILDCAEVRIGNNVLIGPSVQIYTPLHPMDAAVRRTLIESARPVTIGDDVWIGGGAIICPGVTIGSRSVIGAGSVVTRDVPEDSLAVGNPARVIRRIEAGG